MTPYERLLAEQWPTGTFGDARTRTPHRPERPQPARPLWTPAEQAAHYAALEAELGRRPRPTRRLRAVPDAA